MHRLQSWLRNPTLAFAARFNLYAISLAALWTPLGTVLLQQRVGGITPHAFRDTALGIMTFVGIGIAALTEPIAGRISDRAPLPDRRRPFIVGATLLDLLFLLGFWWAPSYGWLFAAYILLQLSSNVAQAAFQALIPDLVRAQERGLASGVKNGYDLLGSIIGLAGVGALLGSGLGEGAALAFIAGMLILGAGVSIPCVPRVSPLPPEERARDLPELVDPRAVPEAFRLDFRAHSAFALATACRFLFLFGMYPVQRFFLYFAQQRYGLQGTGEITSYYFVILILVGVVAAAGTGALSDRVGRLNTLRLGIGFSVVGLFGVAYSPTLLVLLAPGVVMAIGLGTFQAVNWAQLSDFIPGGQEARFYGLSNIAAAGASAMAGLFGPLISWLNGVTSADSYQLAFSLAALLALTSLIPLHWMPAGRRWEP